MPDHKTERVAPSLSSLPKEILTSIALLLDLPSALSFARTSQLLNACCEQRLWQSLNLSISTLPGENMDADLQLENLCKCNSTSEKTRRDHWRGWRLREKVKTVMNAANRRRWGTVTEVRLELRMESTSGFIQLLDNVPNMKSLELNAPPSEQFHYDSDGLDYDSLDARMIKSGLFFPNLTHIRIGPSALTFVELIPLLCNMSPSLASLNIDILHEVSTPLVGLGSDRVPAFTPFERPTKIRQLRLLLPEYEDGYPVVIDILKHSPFLRQFYLEYEDVQRITGNIVKCLDDLAELRELRWNLYVGTFHQDGAEDPPIEKLRVVKRLVLRSYYRHDIFVTIHPMPLLEALYLDYSPEPLLLINQSTSFPEPSRVHRMPTHFADSLRLCPNLRIIHTVRDLKDDGGFDVFNWIRGIESLGQAAGVIRSMRRGDSVELVHARFLLDFYETSDSVRLWNEEPASERPANEKQFLYEQRGVQRVKKYEHRPQAAGWHDFTDYKDRAVPLDVIARMREVEAQGASVGDWEGRGIEVGAAAWKVLTDWEEAEAAKEI